MESARTPFHAEPTQPLVQLLSTLESGEYTSSLTWPYSDDARVVPALRRAFAQRTSKRDKQRIAVTLIHLNDKSDQYFDYLAKYAKEAIQDTTPSPLVYDRNGQLVHGETNPAFQQWCVAQRRDPKEVAGVYLVELPQDVWFLGDTRDARADASA